MHGVTAHRLLPFKTTPLLGASPGCTLKLIRRSVTIDGLARLTYGGLVHTAEVLNEDAPLTAVLTTTDTFPPTYTYMLSLQGETAAAAERELRKWITSRTSTPLTPSPL